MAAYSSTHSSTVPVVVLLRRPSIQPFRFQTFYESQSSSLAAAQRKVSVASPSPSAQEDELDEDVDELAHKLDNTIAEAATIIGQALPLTGESTPREARQVSSSSNTTMAPATPVHNGAPFTPAKNNTSSFHQHSKRLEDSPFSDYFSDNGRSPEPAGTREKQDLLVRLHRLHSLLADDEEKREVVDIVERKIGEIEGLLSALHSQTRLPADMEDSGLFLDDDEDGDGGEEELGEGEGEEEVEAEGDGDGEVEEAEPQSPSPAPHLTQEQKQAEQDFLLLESQRVLARVTQAQEKLRARCAELKQLNDTHITHLAELQAENNTLRLNLQSNASDIEFLKQRFQVLENEVRALDAGAQRLESYAPELREEIQAVKRKRMQESMRHWETQWTGVEGRVRTRGLWKEEVEGGDGQEDGERRESVVQVELGTGDVAGGMELETIETRGEDGKVKSVLVRRVGGKEEGSSPGLSGVEEGDEAEDDEGLEGVVIVEPTPQPPNPADADTTAKASNEEPQPDRHASITTQTTLSQTLSWDPHSGLGLTATGSPVSQSLWDRHSDDMDTEDEDEEEGEGNQLECAITTSSEDNSVPFSSNREKKAKKFEAAAVAAGEQAKSAWQELWSGLTALAGISDDW